jgi:hypothetical protein
MPEIIIERKNGSGDQVFRAANDSDLIEQLRVAQVNATAKIREQSRQIELLTDALIEVLLDRIRKTPSKSKSEKSDLPTEVEDLLEQVSNHLFPDKTEK